MLQLSLDGRTPDCSPGCDQHVEKWQAWWDRTFATATPALLEIPSTRDAYLQTVGPKGRNMLRKANYLYSCRDFDHDHEIDAIEQINQSKPVRSGGPMRDPYLRRPTLTGRPRRLCKIHQSRWVGGYRDTRLLAYCHLIVTHELALVNTILAHGEAMPGGIMNALIDHLVHQLIPTPVRALNYLTLDGPEGLVRFKRSVGFTATPTERSTTR